MGALQATMTPGSVTQRQGTPSTSHLLGFYWKGTSAWVSLQAVPQGTEGRSTGTLEGTEDRGLFPHHES